MPISSVILDVKPGEEKVVSSRLAEMDGVEVAETRDRVIIVTTDTKTIEADRALTESLRDVAGVLNANVAFCSMEDCLDNENSG